MVELSRKYNQKLVKKLRLDNESYNESIDRYNAQDYLFQNSYPVPRRNKISHILDFGAGYGRQANIWSQKRDDILFVGMDAVLKSYCLQHLYYSHLNLPLYDYIVDAKEFKITTDKKGIYHLPTWRADLLPASFFDAVICVQVLPEINEKLVLHMASVFRRILKPGGMLYIRDHDQKWKPTHNMDLNMYLQKNGFVLEFRPHIKDGVDIHGIPRIWRKIDPEVIKNQSYSLIDKSRDTIFKLDSKIGGFILKYFRKFKK